MPSTIFLNAEHTNVKLLATYRIRGIIGKSNIWRFALKMQLTRILFGDFEYYMERNPCLEPKWRTFNLAIFVICQTAKLKSPPN